MMKKYIAAMVAMVLTLMSCTAQSKLLRDLPGGKDVSKVVVGGAMIKLAGQYSTGDSEQYQDLFKEIKSIEVYSSENKKTSSEAVRIFQNSLKTINVEPAVIVEEDGEISNIYTMMSADGNEPEGIIVYNYDTEDGELSIIIIKGKMDISNLEKLAE